MYSYEKKPISMTSYRSNKCSEKIGIDINALQQFEYCYDLFMSQKCGENYSRGDANMFRIMKMNNDGEITTVQRGWLPKGKENRDAILKLYERAINLETALINGFEDAADDSSDFHEIDGDYFCLYFKYEGGIIGIGWDSCGTDAQKARNMASFVLFGCCGITPRFFKSQHPITRHSRLS